MDQAVHGALPLSAWLQQADVPGLCAQGDTHVSNTTVFVLPSLGANPVDRFNQRILADLKLNALERDTWRISRSLSTSTRRAPISRRSRRSAWVPSAV